ncbi:MAG: PD-(D/E)XK motif protein, partial [Candidatus Cloacimonetes bacterium]|nr:PD-(D/E)XK motif protein [Candidatus Cloacimonadota bacterium]
MNKLTEIINETKFENGKLYLIDKPNDLFGFFYQDQIVYFGKRSDNSSTDINPIYTQYLDLNAHVYISNITENSSFKAGYYDLLSFKGELDDQYFDVFCNICLVFSNDVSLSFIEFFTSLVDIFQKAKESTFKNLIGLIGEFFLIKQTYETQCINVSNNWHMTGINSKFDFCFKNFNIEVKTTTKSEQKFLLKHSQIFNNQNNYVCVVSLIETGEGE